MTGDNMKIIEKENLSEIVGMLLEGKVLVLPSESSYGISCDATNQSAVKKIFAIKGRSSDKPFLLVVSSIDMAKKYLEWNEKIDELAKKYWPGPLTIVGKSTISSGLAPSVISKDGTVAIRVTAYAVIAELVDIIGVPLVSTSANIAGNTALYASERVINTFFASDSKPDFFYDIGDLLEKTATTIVKVSGDVVEVLREGEIKF